MISISEQSAILLRNMAAELLQQKMLAIRELDAALSKEEPENQESSINESDSKDNSYTEAERGC